jgi:hypothetical protein
MARIQETFLFTPTSVPGCQLWLDGADPNGTGVLPANNGTVSTWVDKSGRVNNGTTTAGTLTYSTQSRGVVFNGSSYYSVPNNTFPTGNTNYSFFIVASTGLANFYWFLGAGVTSAGQAIGYVTYPNGTIENGWWTTNFTTAAGTVLPNQTTLLESIYSSPTLTTLVNGSSRASSSSLGSRNNPAGPNVIGARPDSTSGSVIQAFVGVMNEIILFASGVSLAQQQQIEGYLAWKWGLQDNLPSNHPFKSYRPLAQTPFPTAVPRMPTVTQTLPVFAPTQISGCSFWLDAADTTSMTLSGTTLTQWRDKSSNAYVGTAVASPALATVNGLPAVTFNGSSQYINFGDVADLGSNQLNLFVVSRFNTSADGTLVAKSYYGEQAYRYSLLRAGGALTPLLQALGGPQGSGIADTNTSTRLLSWTWDRSTVILYQNGTSVFSTAYSSAATFDSAQFLLIGAYNYDVGGGVPPTPGLYLNGSINEILFYFTTLTTAQRQQVEGYLAWKWGLVSSLPNGHPYKTLQIAPFPFSVTPIRGALGQWVPTQVSGCQLWLDAADPTTISLSGTNITQWNDKSGNTNTAIAGTSTYPTYTRNALNGQPIVGLRGTNDYFLVSNNFTTTAFPSITYFIVINPAASQQNNEYAGILSTDTPAAFGRTLGFGAGNWQQEYYSGFTNITPYSTNAWSLVSLGFVGTSSAIFCLNGVPYAATASGTGTNTTGFKIGSYNDTGGYGTYNANFDCGEILVYGGSLSVSQRQQVEGYLAWKWGLVGNLPGNHPFKLFPPPP